MLKYIIVGNWIEFSSLSNIGGFGWTYIKLPCCCFVRENLLAHTLTHMKYVHIHRRELFSYVGLIIYTNIHMKSIIIINNHNSNVVIYDLGNAYEYSFCRSRIIWYNLLNNALLFWSSQKYSLFHTMKSYLWHVRIW